jgi:trehalose 6-phosphate phosphatase
VLPRESAEAVTGALVRSDGLVVGVLRIGGDLLRDRPHLTLDRGAVGGLAQQRVHPALRAVPGREVVVEEELAEQDAGADVGERLEGEDPVRRLDQGRERRVVAQDTVDDPADGLVDEWDPELVEVGHERIMPGAENLFRNLSSVGLVAHPDDLLARLAAEPGETGLFLDFDGVLAPIVERPEDARVPSETRRELARLDGSYGLVACVTGRTSVVAREIVGVPGLRYVGQHGLELEPAAAGFAERIHAFAEATGWLDLEVKPLTAAFHYRRAGDRDAARLTLEDVASRALAAGFRTKWGRFVLEVVPPIDASKGSAVHSLLDDSGLRRALYAGDDVTDLDGFRALDGLDLAVRVAIASTEGPSELGELADLIVGSTDAFLEILKRL